MFSADYYDISPEISEHTAVFPGDTPYHRNVALDFTRGDNLVLSSVTSTVHIGAHADAPSHYHRDGKAIHTRSLLPYAGDCQVIHAHAPRGVRLTPEHLHHRTITAPRVLLRTDSYPDPNTWNGDFNALSVPLIEHLVQRGVVLVGIDTPSVDLADDQDLEAHNAIFRHDLCILEGIVLHEVPEGIYNLTALPLRLRDADAAPVRAVLWKK